MTKLSVLAAALFLLPATAWAAPTVAIFPFELIDSSLEGEVSGVNTDETRRLQTITDDLRKLVAADGRFAVADLSGLAKDIETAAPIHKCNGCDVDLAKKAGAELAMTGTVQKVSNLILNINIYIRDVATGNLKREMSADMRGNTDESWIRTLRWLVKNRLFVEEKASQ